MSVADRWHSSRARDGARCKEHGLIPSAVHGQGDRWQVRWRDENGAQKKRNFALRQGKDPDKHADAFDAKVKISLDDGSYIDPGDADGTFQAYAEEWLKSRTHDEVTAILVERQLRLHVYQDPAYPGRTPSGGIPLGHRTWRDLGKRPSITQAWIAGMKLGAGSKIQVIRTVSSVFIAAIDDGLIGRNPTQAKSVQRPKLTPKKAVPWAADRVRAGFSLVFTDGRGKAVNRNIFNRDAWKPALAAAGVIPPRKPGNRNWPAARDDGVHALRHTAASAWLSRGVDITAVAAWLGDTVATVYTYYAHLMPDADERGRAAMTGFFAELAGRDCAPPVPQAR
jgi:hypothetical protein